MSAGRIASAVALFGAACCVPLIPRLDLLAIAAAVGFASHLALQNRLSQALASALPIVLFAALLVFLQWIGDGIQWTLPLRTVAIFFLATSAARLFPWTPLLQRVRPGGVLFNAVLFLFILRHFVMTLGAEARRVMIARRIAVPREYRPEWFRSLTSAVAAIFGRAIVRAERFYACQLLRGIGE